jgi:hypothetical protein
LKKIRNSLDAECFKDGIVWFYPLTRKGEPDKEKGRRFYFAERNLTFKRIFEARQIQAEYTRVICVPLTAPGFLGKMKCAVIGGKTYRLESVQEIYTAFPPCAVVGLSDRNIDTRL